MAGVIALALLGVWAVVGRWVWKNYLRRRVPARRTGAVGFAFAVAWFVVPVGDDILGAYHFERLCAEIPPTRFYGPIAVGPGAFFNEDGTRKWKNSGEFARIVMASREWDNLWDRSTEQTKIASWPINVFQLRHVRVDRSTKRVVVESYYRGSGGGVLKRTIGSGLLGTYQCPSVGRYPDDEDTIVFANRQPNAGTGSSP